MRFELEVGHRAGAWLRGGRTGCYALLSNESQVVARHCSCRSLHAHLGLSQVVVNAVPGLVRWGAVRVRLAGVDEHLVLGVEDLDARERLPDAALLGRGKELVH